MAKNKMKKAKKPTSKKKSSEKKTARKVSEKRPRPKSLRKSAFKKVKVSKSKEIFKAPVQKKKRKVVVKVLKREEPKAAKMPRRKGSKKINVKIQRFIPDQDINPYFVDYDYTLKEKDTIALMLHNIKWEQDETLAFRKGCRAGICGSCALRVNGRAVLACNTLIKDLLSEDKTSKLVIEPLKNFKVIRDLIVDMEPYWRAMKKSKNWLVPKKADMTSEQMEKIEEAAECINCGACVSDCSVSRDDSRFMGPAAILKSYRFIYDPRDDLGMERLYNCHVFGIWKCTEMFACVEQCPKEIDLYSAIAELREEAIERGFLGAGVRYTKSFYKSVRSSGKLDEARLMLAADPLRAVKSITPALRMLKHDKKPSFLPSKIKGYRKFRKSIENAEKEERTDEKQS